MLLGFWVGVQILDIQLLILTSFGDIRLSHKPQPKYRSLYYAHECIDLACHWSDSLAWFLYQAFMVMLELFFKR